MSFKNSFDLLNTNTNFDSKPEKKKKSKASKALKENASAAPPAPPASDPAPGVPPAKGPKQMNVDVPEGAAGKQVFSPGWTDSRGAGGKPVSGEALSVTLEDAAKHAVDTVAKLGLWKDWVQQAGESQGRFVKDGRHLDFQEVFQESAALEITLENCLKPPMSPSGQGDLQALLTAFLPATCGKDAPKMLANLVVKLASALVDESEDIVYTAQQSLHAAVATLKASVPSAEDLLPKLQELDRLTVERSAKLKELEMGGDKNAKLGERTRCSADLLKLCEGKLELITKPVMTSSTTGKPLDPGAAMLSLQDLASLTDDRLKQAANIANMYSAGNTEKVMANMRQQEAQLAQQAANTAAEIDALEARLKGLRMQASQIEAQRAMLTKSRATSNGKTDGEAARAAARRHEQQLQSIRGLENMLMQHCNTVSSSVNSQQTATNAPLDYLNALESQLKYKNMQQLDMLVRLQSLQRQGLFKVDDTDLRSLGLLQEQAQMAQKLKNMVKDILNAADALNKSVEGYNASLNSHARHFPGHTIPTVQRINALFESLHVGHFSIVSQSTSEPKPLPKPQPLEKSPPSGDVLPKPVDSARPQASRAAEAAVAAADAVSASPAPNPRKNNNNNRSNNSNTKRADGNKADSAAAPPNASSQRSGNASNQKATSKQAAAPNGPTKQPAASAASASANGQQIDQPVPVAPVSQTPEEAKVMAEIAPAASVPLPAPPPKPTRGWGKVATTSASVEAEHQSEPTPAEAMAKASKP